MAHVSFIAARTLALTMLAAGALAALGCTSTVTGGGAKGENGGANGAKDENGGAGGAKDENGGAGGAKDENGGAGGAKAENGGAGGSVADNTCSMGGNYQSCSLPGDPGGGYQLCAPDANGHLFWGPCSSDSSAESTPLVLSFDGAPVAFAAGLRAFDLAATMSVVTDWPSASTPWLALDRDGNGSIDDGSELFGSATVLRSGARAANGFLALAELDSNGDGRITPEDAAWSSLRLWSDADGDRASTPGELAPLAARRILSIDLRYTSERRCDARDNCEVERASFRWADEAGVEHTGTIVDVHLRHQAAR